MRRSKIHQHLPMVSCFNLYTKLQTRCLSVSETSNFDIEDFLVDLFNWYDKSLKRQTSVTFNAQRLCLHSFFVSILLFLGYFLLRSSWIFRVRSTFHVKEPIIRNRKKLLKSKGNLTVFLHTCLHRSFNDSCVDTGRKLNAVFWTSYVRPIYVLCLRGPIISKNVQDLQNLHACFYESCAKHKQRENKRNISSPSIFHAFTLKELDLVIKNPPNKALWNLTSFKTDFFAFFIKHATWRQHILPTSLCQLGKPFQRCSIWNIFVILPIRSSSPH